MRGWLRSMGLALFVAGGVARADGFEPVTPVSPQAAVPMMVNLAPLADWGVQQPFMDRMKVARPWIGHLPRRWGGVTHDDLAARGLLDADGWPTQVPHDVTSVATLIMVDLPAEATSLAGRYVLRFEGNGIVEAGGRASNQRYGKNQVSFDFTPGPGGVEVKIQRSDRARNGDYVRNITVVREDRVETFDQGAIFNPDFLAVIDGFEGLRYMDWMHTNNSTLSEWAERPRPGDYTYVWRGIPAEIVIELSNRTGTMPWVTLPHLADDGYFRGMAELIAAQLDPDLPVYVEYSNEVWNWSFQQAHWAEEQARARWGIEHRWLNFYGMRAMEMAQIWRQVFADAPDRLVTVMAVQAAWLGLEDQALRAEHWLSESPDNRPPHGFFDAYAITGYFSGNIGTEQGAPMVHEWLDESAARAEAAADAEGLTGAARTRFIDTHRYDLAFALAGAEMLDGSISGNPENSIQDLVTRVLPYHREIADRYGMELIMYEGGTHIVGLGPVMDDTEIDAFFRAFNYSEEMGALYTHLLAGWAANTDGPFNIYNDVYRPLKWGSWGALRHLTDENPRWDAIQLFLKGPDG